MRFRVGVNLGDVLVSGDDLLGDGVNVAARLEGLAEAGEICISGAVHEQVRDRIDNAFQDLGEQELKNIDHPVRVYRILSGREGDVAPPPAARTADGSTRPSIAVLPFDNMGGDPDQAYFADGITEDLITELTRFQELSVVARNTVFTYKNTPANVRDVGRDLGVRYVLEGSVRKAGNRVRVTAQLIDGESGLHLWAERFDRTLEDVFEAAGSRAVVQVHRREEPQGPRPL
jgi:adenylate cyclase